MIELKEYIELSEKIIYKYGRFKPSEDDISFVSEYMMRADVRYKEGVGDRDQFRVVNGRFAVRTLMSNKNKKYKKEKPKVLSLDFDIDQELTLKNVESIPDEKQKTPDVYFEYNEILSFIEKDSSLTEKEKEVLQDFVSRNCVFRRKELEKDGIKYSVYNRILKKALSKIKFHYN